MVGLPSEQWGQRVAAVVVLDRTRVGPSWGIMDLRRALKGRLAMSKIPTKVKVLEKIPRNAMGKGEKIHLLDPRTSFTNRCSEQEDAGQGGIWRIVARPLIRSTRGRIISVVSEADVRYM